MKSLRIPLVAVAAAQIVCALSVSCSEEKHTYVPNMGDPARTPTMVTTDVSTFISDSGYTRYHIETPLWNIFDDLEDPLWTFPKGIDLEQYDNAMRPHARMRCDSATYYSRRRLWRLDGHVVMVNTARDTFLTSQLFWDQNQAKVYSDSFMHVSRASHIIEGYGFTSNQTMTAYTVTRPTAIIPVTRPGQDGQQQTAVPGADTLQPRQRGIHSGNPEPASRRRQRVYEVPADDAPQPVRPNGNPRPVPPVRR